MKKILGLLVILSVVLGLTGCSMNVAPTMFEEPSQNKIEWIVTDNESRDASTTPTWGTDTLEYVTIEIYKVPNRNGKFIHKEKEYLETRTLRRGDILPFKSMKDYDYKYVTSIKVIEFNSYNVFCNEGDEIFIFDYDDTVGMEVSANYGGPLRTKNEGKHNEWTLYSDRILHRDDVVGYEDFFYFLKKSSLKKFYDEHKDGGRIVWDN